jgi:two-component system chemotaxis response regulator CheB
MSDGLAPPAGERGPTRVLVVDDSAFARKVLRETLARDPRLEVVGTARDGLEALEKIAELRPEVITLDLVMPNLDGIGVLRALPQDNAPRVVVVSISDADSALGIEALQLGAVDLVHKPTALATERLYELSEELTAKVLAAAGARARAPSPYAAAGPPARAPARRTGRVRLVVIGTSTGGPQALTRLLSALPRDLPCAVAVALHIPAGYTDALARRLDETCLIRVYEAVDGGTLEPGAVAIARGGVHLRLTADDRAIVTHLEAKPLIAPFCPSVNVLFESAAAAVGPAVLGVVLTGMGDDGVVGARAIRQAGGRILSEAESSCVVYGMPRAIVEAKLNDGVADIDQMAEAILQRL